MTPRVLLAHSLKWPNVARLSVAFRRAGFSVDVVAPRIHAVHRMRSPSRTFVYRPTDPLESLRKAIEVSEPELIVPCDDQIVGQLHALHRASLYSLDRSGLKGLSTLIETSLGSPKSFELLTSKRLLGTLPLLPGVHIPRTDAIESLRQLRAWTERNGTPAVLKLDGSWGGRDVVLVRNKGSIALAYLEMQLRRSRLRNLRRSLLGGGIRQPAELPRERAPGFGVQSYVAGRLANCSIACWRGEVLASIAVEVVRRESEFGMATVVRLVEGEPMIAAARSIASHLELSGMYGFDFVLDEKTGQANLIEINPRTTQINHLSLRRGGDLPAALRRALCGERAEAGLGAPLSDEIALFPQEWRRDPKSPFLASALHDVPYEEPELLRFYGYEPDARAAYADADVPYAVAGDAVSPHGDGGSP